MDKQSLNEKLAGIVSRFEEVRLAYLFGSQVSGPVGPISDCDIAALLDRTADEAQVHVQLILEIVRALETDRVDVVLLDRAPVELAYAVIAQGELLYQRDLATRVEFEAQVMGRYGDYLPVLRAQRDDILRGDERGTRVQRYRTALGRTERALGQIAAVQRQGTDRV
jgi:predicted nucleotidyltransferase